MVTACLYYLVQGLHVSASAYILCACVVDLQCRQFKGRWNGQDIVLAIDINLGLVFEDAATKVSSAPVSVEARRRLKECHFLGR